MNSSYSFTLRLKSLLLSKVKLNTSKICETFSSESFATWLSWLTTFVSFSAGKGKTPSLIFEDDHSFTISSSDLLDFVTVSSICELKDELFSNITSSDKSSSSISFNSSPISLIFFSLAGETRLSLSSFFSTWDKSASISFVLTLS